MPASSDGRERLLKEKVHCNLWAGWVQVSAVVPLLFAVIALASYPGSAAVSASEQSKSQALPKPITEPMPTPTAAPEPAPPPPTPEQLPPHAPEVVWDGKQLSIKADNSTLYDVLVAVRSRLGASIDVPVSASSERVALRLGPAPARAVLTALLEGSNYDYIIQEGESNKDEIQSMILTLRGKGNDGDTHDDRDTNSGSMAISGAARRMPGYSRSGRPAFQEQMGPDQESSSTPDPPTAPVGETTEAAAVSTDSNQPAAQPVAETPVPSRDASPVATSLGGSNPLVIQSTPVTAGAVVGPTPITTPEMTDQLQRMYEQRRQMQSQQNQGTTPPSHP